MDPVDVLQRLKDRDFGLVEAYHDWTFRCIREKRDGSLQRFTLTISDAGPTLHPNARYRCTVETDRGREVRGNPSDTLEGALYILQALDDVKPRQTRKKQGPKRKGTLHRFRSSR